VETAGAKTTRKNTNKLAREYMNNK